MITALVTAYWLSVYGLGGLRLFKKKQQVVKHYRPEWLYSTLEEEQ